MFFVVVMILATSNVYAQTNTEVVNGLKFSLDETTLTATLTNYGWDKYSGNIVVPEIVTANDGKKYTVTAFDDNCFNGCNNLTGITIPFSVSSLGENCFACTRITSINIPSSVTSLGGGCFVGCRQLSSVTIPSTIKYIVDNCFQDCSSLTSITIPSSVIGIGYASFKNCSNLESINFDGSVPNFVIIDGSTGEPSFKFPATKSGIPISCHFYVPKEYLQVYKEALGSDYLYIYAKNEDGGDDKPKEQCNAPIITYAEGKLHFLSSTPGAEYYYTINDANNAHDTYSQNGTIDFSSTYQISAYATADGYQPSDKATATLYWINANLENDPSSDINQVKNRNIVVTSNGGVVNISGLDDGEMVTFFSTDGRMIGNAKANHGIASYAVSDSIIIVKVGDKAIKLTIKK